jgi:quercetin dioxygenase-like cupin family protein
MIGYKYAQLPAEQVKPGVIRRTAHTDNLMIVIVDFDDGPKEEPDPPHWHPHEQVTYVAEGEIIFYMDDQQMQLGPGDVFTVPAEKPHTIRLLTQNVRLVDCFTPIRADFLKE